MVEDRAANASQGTLLVQGVFVLEVGEDVRRAMPCLSVHVEMVRVKFLMVPTTILWIPPLTVSITLRLTNLLIQSYILRLVQPFLEVMVAVSVILGVPSGFVLAVSLAINMIYLVEQLAGSLLIYLPVRCSCW